MPEIRKQGLVLPRTKKHEKLQKPRILYAFAPHEKVSDVSIIEKAVRKEINSDSPVKVIAIESLGASTENIASYTKLQEAIDVMHAKYMEAKRQGIPDSQILPEFFNHLQKIIKSEYGTARFLLAAKYGLIVYPLEARPVQTAAALLQRGEESQRLFHETQKANDLAQFRELVKQYMLHTTELSIEREKHIVENTPALFEELVNHYPKLKEGEFKVLISIGDGHTPLLLKHLQAGNAYISARKNQIIGRTHAGYALKMMSLHGTNVLDEKLLVETAVAGFLTEKYFGKVQPQNYKLAQKIAKSITPQDFEALAKKTKGIGPIETAKAILKYYQKKTTPLM